MCVRNFWKITLKCKKMIENPDVSYLLMCCFGIIDHSVFLSECIDAFDISLLHIPLVLASTCYHFLHALDTRPYIDSFFLRTSECVLKERFSKPMAQFSLGLWKNTYSFAVWKLCRPPNTFQWSWIRNEIWGKNPEEIQGVSKQSLVTNTAAPENLAPVATFP